MSLVKTPKQQTTTTTTDEEEQQTNNSASTRRVALKAWKLRLVYVIDAFTRIDQKVW